MLPDNCSMSWIRQQGWIESFRSIDNKLVVWGKPPVDVVVPPEIEVIDTTETIAGAISDPYHVEIDPHFLAIAEEKAAKLGALNNSIRKGEGNTVGYLGEFVLASLMNETVVSDTSYDYDLASSHYSVDVKTKEVTTPPLMSYNCTVAKANTRQDCDIYAFVRIHERYDEAWVLGYMFKDEFLKNAYFGEKGKPDPEKPSWTFRADCYNIKIEALRRFKMAEYKNRLVFAF